MAELEVVREVEQAPVRVHVGVPAYGNAPAICMLSFGSFIGAGVAQGLIAHLGEVEGAYIDRSRNDLVRQALANESTHVLFVDQDMILPEGCLKRMVQHDVPIVGGSYFGKDDYFTPVSFHLDPFRRIYELDECPIVDTTAELPDGIGDCWCGKPDDHLHQVGGTGMGCTLIKTSLFRQIKDHFKDEMWFSSKETGEDIHFCTRAHEVGVDVLLDGFVQCGHVRNQIITRQHYDWARQNAPKCRYPGCDRVAFWHTGDDDAAVESKRCWVHKREGESGRGDTP